MAITAIDNAEVAYELDVATGPVTTFAIPRPTAGGALVAGDVLVAMITLDLSTTTDPSVTWPSGWVSLWPYTRVGTTASASMSSEARYHIVTAGEVASPPASWDVTLGSSVDGAIAVQRFRGVDNADPIAVSSPAAGYSTATQATGTTTKVAPAVTTDAANAMLITGAACRSGSQTLTSVATGYTVGSNAFGIGGKPAGIAYKAQAAAGASGTATWTHTGSLSGYAWQSALKESTGAAPDTTAPTVPGSVAAVADSATQVTINWAASTDAVGVASYRVRRGGVDLAGASAVAGTSFVDTSVVASTAYSYTVSAVDSAGNRSAESAAANVTTPAPPAGGTDYTVKWDGTSASAILPADSATAVDIAPNNARMTMEAPYTGTQYDPNKVIQLINFGPDVDIASAVANGNYASFTINRAGGMLPKAIRLKAARGGSSAGRGFGLRSSVDGYAADIYGGNVPTQRPALTQYSADLSAMAQQTSITFRIYQYAPSTNNSVEYDDIEFDYTTPGGATVTVPTVGAGSDASHTVNTAFSRTATENANGGTITSRAWTIQSGPAGVGTTIGTAAALSWTPTVTGTYTLRYTATNSAGSGFDDAVITVSAASFAGSLLSRVVDVPTTTTAAVKVRTSSVNSVRLKVGTNSAVTTGVVFGSAVTPSAQNASQLSVSGLTAGTKYYYRVEMTDTNGTVALDSGAVGEFYTAPSGPSNFAFDFGSCTDAADSAAMAAIAARDDALFFHLGDLYYADGSGTGIANFRTKMSDKVTVANHAAVFSTTASVYTPSDHDGMTNDGTAGGDATAWTNWNTAYREYFGTSGIPGVTGVYRTFAWGRVRFIVLDTRSFCSNPANADNASKTKLGATQKQWVKDTITAAAEPVVVIVQDTPWNASPDATSDSWEGFTTERTELANFFASSPKRIGMLGGDMHALAADTGTNMPGGIFMFHAAPLNNSASQKGGPYTAGPYPASGTAAVQQYGRCVVTDDGSLISLAFTGYSSDNTSRVTTTINVPAPTTGLVIDRWNGSALVRLRSDKWDGAALDLIKVDK